MYKEHGRRVEDAPGIPDEELITLPGMTMLMEAVRLQDDHKRNQVLETAGESKQG